MIDKESRFVGRPLTTAEHFHLICSILREKGLMPDDILDYALAASHPVPVRTCEFDTRNNLDYGASEGIYLDLAIEYYEDGRKKTSKLGTFKTLQTDPEAMRTMARLLADFIVEEQEYVSAHMDAYTWTGVDVYAVDEDGRWNGWGYSCHNLETALKRKDELLEQYESVVVRDNATRKMKVYRRGGEE